MIINQFEAIKMQNENINDFIKYLLSLTEIELLQPEE